MKTMFKQFNPSVLVIVWAISSLACGSNNGSRNIQYADDTPSSGTIRLSVDESFKPVIDSQIKVYEASYPNTKLLATYKPEAECLKDLNNDSVRMVIVTRALSEGEENQLQADLSFRPASGLLAYDAVAVVVNKQGADSMFSRQELADILAGTDKRGYQVVMDGVKATSTVRYAVDSILKGRPLGANVVAAASSPEVIDAVAASPKSIGMLGVSWIGNTDDPQQLSFLNKVKVASIECGNCSGFETHVKPFQANIALRRYPLVRGLYFIVKENFNGLGKGFANFMIYERGQLIFQHAYLFPARMNFEVRDVEIRDGE